MHTQLPLMLARKSCPTPFARVKLPSPLPNCAASSGPRPAISGIPPTSPSLQRWPLTPRVSTECPSKQNKRHQNYCTYVPVSAICMMHITKRMYACIEVMNFPLVDLAHIAHRQLQMLHKKVNPVVPLDPQAQDDPPTVQVRWDPI